MSLRHDSENEDDPEPFESSGDEWDVEDYKLEQNGRRKSGRISRKPKRTVVEESASEPEEEDEDDYFSEEERPSKKRKSAGSARKPTKSATPKKKIKVTNESDNDTNSNMSQEDKKNGTATDSDSSRTGKGVPCRGVHRKFIPKKIYSEDYATGSFVILKSDAEEKTLNKHPVIWRIDGKALLQKFEAFDEECKVLHKSTSIYTGWSPLDKDSYIPIEVSVVRHNNTELTVQVQWSHLKVRDVNADSPDSD